MVSISCLCSVYRLTSVSQFRSAIDSLLAGVRLPNEIVVVIDGPIAADLSELINSYSEHNYVRIVPLDRNQGLAIALNAGLAICSSEIVCRFDTDDINLPERLDSIGKAFEADARLDILGSAMFEFSDSHNGGIIINLKRTLAGHSAITNRMNWVNPLNHPTVAFRRYSIQSIGGYRHMRFFEDYYLWLIAKHNGLRFENLEAPLVCMRRTGLLSRRSGLSYLWHEAYFYYSAITRGFISPWFSPLFAVRLLSRLLPGFLQGFQSLLPWRVFLDPCACPNLSRWLNFESELKDYSEVGFPYWSSCDHLVDKSFARVRLSS